MTNVVVQIYREALKSPELNVRRAATRGLGEIGPESKDAVPELIESLNDEDMDLIAVWALGQIGPAAIAAAPAIKQWLDKVNSRCRQMSKIQGQLLYLPEDERRGLVTKDTYNENRDQVTQYG